MGKWASIDMILDSVMDVCDGKTRVTWASVLEGKQKFREQLYRSSSKTMQYHLCHCQYSAHLFVAHCFFLIKRTKL